MYEVKEPCNPMKVLSFGLFTYDADKIQIGLEAYK